MLLSFSSIILLLIEVNTFVLHPTYIINLEDSIDYDFEKLVTDEDYQLMKDSEATKRVENKKNKMLLEKLAGKWNDDKSRQELQSTGRVLLRSATLPTESSADYGQDIVLGYTTTGPNLSGKKENIRKRRESSEEYIYDYDHFLKEYYEQSLEEAKLNSTFNASIAEHKANIITDVKKIFSLDLKVRNCTEEELQHIGLKALNCIVQDYRAHREHPQTLLRRLVKICKVWLAVYLFIAIPLWCTKGWCCCCLFCKVFQPHRTIREASSYLLQNPPGVMRDRYGRETTYAATNQEVERYEELEHYIRTM